MEDSSHENLDDQPASESKMNRREMAKLLGAVTALSASLGVTFVASAANLPEGSQLKLKFLKEAANGDPAKAQLLCTIDVSPGDQQKIAAADGPVELRVVAVSLQKVHGPGTAREAGNEVTVSSHTISKVAVQMIKLSPFDK